MSGQLCPVCCGSFIGRIVEAGYVVDRVACYQCGAERLEPHTPVDGELPGEPFY